MPPKPSPAVFLSYASQDAEAVRRIAEALRAAGVEVWFDQNELVGGDAWDAKIRGQIASCALFVPVISAATQARLEGYFRIEWKLAAQRTHAMAEEKAFLLPVVIDDTRDAEAKVPGEFRAVQWTRLPGGEGPAVEKFCARVSKLLGGDAVGPIADRAAGSEVGAPLDGARGRGRATPRRKPARSWLIPATLGIAAVVALALWQPWRRSTASSSASAPAAQRPVDVAATTSVGPTAQALQLRAFEGLSRERLGAAEELLAQALKTAPTDAEALAVAAQVDALMVYRSWDMSEERRQSATRRSARALALAPEGFESRRAQAMVAGFMIRSPESAKEAETLYRALAAERPGDPSVLEELGTLLQVLRRHDEAAQVFVQGRRPQLAGNAYYAAGRVEEARRIADELLAQRRTAAALSLKANVELFGYNDFAAAQAAVNQLTSTELREDDAAGISLRLAVLSRDAPGLLRLLEPFPHPFVSIGGVNYPRQYWTGLARSLLNQPEAAQIEWRGGLRSLEERLRSRPNDADALSWAAMLHAVLGNRADMEQALRTYANYRDLTTGRWDFNYCLPLLRVGERTDEVLARLAKSLRDTASFNRIVYAWARYSPEFDPIRGDPRFEQLLREVRPKLAKPFDDEVSARPAAPAPDPKSVAVLAFANLSNDAENEYFSDGIADELLTILQKIPGLRVAARTSAFSFKGKGATAKEVGEKLGMAHVVEGSVQKSGKRVKITARLSRAATNEEVWSESFGPLEMTDIFATQSEIAQKIVAQLRGQLTGETAANPANVAAAVTAEIRSQVQAAAKGGTKNLEAHELFLQGRFLATRSGSADVARGIAYYERALQLDPNFTLAWAAVARARVWQMSWEPLNADRFLQARAAVDRALALDPDLADAHSTLSQVLLRHAYDWRAARAASARALALAPSDAAVLTDAAATEQALGSLEESVALARRAVALDPVAIDARFYLALSQLFMDRLAEAEAETRRMIELSPNGIFIHGLLSSIHLMQGRNAEALAAAQKETEKMYRIQSVSVSLFALAQIRESDAALAEMIKEFKDIGPYPIAWAYAMRKDRDKAFEWLERAYQLRDAGISWVRGDTLFKPLHADPRWPVFLRKIGLADDQLK
jgi:TolB-like protein/Tfp pilus assembly protein PilF